MISAGLFGTVVSSGLQRTVATKALCLVSAGAALLAGCSASAPQTKTGYSLIVPEGSETYVEQKNQKFLLGDRIGEAVLPVYPADLVGRHLSTQVVCVEVDIDETGKVYASRPLFGVSACPGSEVALDARFLASAQAAVRQWAFRPARMCTFPSAAAVNDRCSAEGVVVEAMPVRYAYSFYFEQTPGGAKVVSRAVRDR
jgi:hypothetical protein